MNVGVVVLVVVRQRLDHRARLLRCRAVVEVDEWVAVGLLGEHGEVGAIAQGVEARSGTVHGRRMGGELGHAYSVEQMYSSPTFALSLSKSAWRGATPVFWRRSALQIRDGPGGGQLHLAGADAGWRLRGERQPKRLQQQLLLGLGLGVTRHDQHSPVAGGQVHFEHLDGRQGLQCLPRSETGAAVDSFKRSVALRQ